MFCPRCGHPLPDGSAFCNICGKPLNSINAERVTPVAVQPTYAPRSEKKPIPGKGLGVAGMVLGIIGLILSIPLVILGAVAASFSGKVVGIGAADVGPFLLFVFFMGLPSFLSMIFSLCAYGKGCRLGSTKAGIVLGTMGFVLVVFSALILLSSAI